jgi:hypothetical protein
MSIDIREALTSYEYDDYIIEQEEEFKKKKFYFSFSSLVKLMLDPRKFYKEYVLGVREDLSAKFLDIGSLLHCLVLEPENFDNKFVIMSKKVPGGKLKDVIDEVYKIDVKPFYNENKKYSLDDFRVSILEKLKEQDLYQNLVDAKRKDANGIIPTADDKRFEKAVTAETRAYFSILLESEKKTIVDMDMSLKARDKANAILNNPAAMTLLTSQNIKEDVRKEMELKAELKGYPFGLKGILDCVKIDYKNATIHIVDLKTTSKSLDDWTKAFMTSVYNYWLQPIVYKELLLSLIPKNSKADWTMRIHYIVVDKDNQVYCYPVSPESLKKWEYMAKGAYDIGKWHLETDNYELPYNYAKGLVKL